MSEKMTRKQLRKLVSGAFKRKNLNDDKIDSHTVKKFKQTADSILNTLVEFNKFVCEAEMRKNEENVTNETKHDTKQENVKKQENNDIIILTEDKNNVEKIDNDEENGDNGIGYEEYDESAHDQCKNFYKSTKFNFLLSADDISSYCNYYIKINNDSDAFIIDDTQWEITFNFSEIAYSKVYKIKDHIINQTAFVKEKLTKTFLINAELKDTPEKVPIMLHQRLTLSNLFLGPIKIINSDDYKKYKLGELKLRECKYCEKDNIVEASRKKDYYDGCQDYKTNEFLNDLLCKGFDLQELRFLMGKKISAEHYDQIRTGLWSINYENFEEEDMESFDLFVENFKEKIINAADEDDFKSIIKIFKEYEIIGEEEDIDEDDKDYDAEEIYDKFIKKRPILDMMNYLFVTGLDKNGKNKKYKGEYCSYSDEGTPIPSKLEDFLIKGFLY